MYERAIIWWSFFFLFSLVLFDILSDPSWSKSVDKTEGSEQRSFKWVYRGEIFNDIIMMLDTVFLISVPFRWMRRFFLHIICTNENRIRRSTLSGVIQTLEKSLSTSFWHLNFFVFTNITRSCFKESDKRSRLSEKSNTELPSTMRLRC